MQPDPFAQQHQSSSLAPEDLARRLRWRARRGLLENDLVMERFFQRFGESLTMEDHDGLATLLNLTDNDLLTLLLGREEPKGDLDCPPVHGVLTKLRAA
jgi:antitoxin CptB